MAAAAFLPGTDEAAFLARDGGSCGSQTLALGELRGGGAGPCLHGAKGRESGSPFLQAAVAAAELEGEGLPRSLCLWSALEEEGCHSTS